MRRSGNLSVLSLVSSSRFRRDVKRMKKRGRDLERLATALTMLAREDALPLGCRRHALTGDWTGFRDLYIEPVAAAVAHCRRRGPAGTDRDAIRPVPVGSRYL